jgi:polyisoprenoid-binding protein YceI
LAAAEREPSARGQELYTIDRGHSEVAFRVRHLVTRVRGRFREFDGTIRLNRERPEASSVELRILAASIDTDLAERDTHLRSADFLDVEKHAEITFVSERVRALGHDFYQVTGVLTLRGVSKTVTLAVRLLGFATDPWGNEKAGFEAGLTLNRKDFGIVWNQALDSGGLILGDHVEIAVNLETVKQKNAA